MHDDDGNSSKTAAVCAPNCQLPLLFCKIGIFGMKESVCPFSLQTTNNTIALYPFLMTHVHVFTYKDGSLLLSLSSDIQREREHSYSYYYISTTQVGGVKYNSYIMWASACPPLTLS